jgi:hypothetical protein
MPYIHERIITAADEIHYNIIYSTYMPQDDDNGRNDDRDVTTTHSRTCDAKRIDNILSACKPII